MAEKLTGIPCDYKKDKRCTFPGSKPTILIDGKFRVDPQCPFYLARATDSNCMKTPSQIIADELAAQNAIKLAGKNALEPHQRPTTYG